MTRYQIAEWYGEPFVRMPPARRQELANAALGNSPIPICPFQKNSHVCSKKGGVCSLQVPDSTPVTICPNRFAEDNLIPMAYCFESAPQNIDSRWSRTFGSKIRAELTGIQPFRPDFGAN